MKIGICASPDHFAETAALGYDYFEVNAAGLESMTEDEYRAFRRLQTPEYFCESSNVLFPGTIRLTGPEPASSASVAEYLKRTFSRLAGLGVKVSVFGSGGARNCPEGFPAEEALKQFAEVCAAAGEIAADSGILVAVEELNRSETNLLNSYADALEFARKLAHPNVRVMADFYHIRREREPFSDLNRSGDFLCHCHAAGEKRGAPSEQDLFLAEAAEQLRALGYSGRISVEAHLDPFRGDAAVSLRTMRKIFQPESSDAAKS